MTRVLFVCIGNSCRSQMAEGFARTYGADVLIPASAGTNPAATVSRDTARVMWEKNIDVTGQFPKSLQQVTRDSFDLVVNMSGAELPPGPTPVRTWSITDPIGSDLETFRTVRDQIEMAVMQLILELRRANKKPRT